MLFVGCSPEEVWRLMSGDLSPSDDSEEKEDRARHAETTGQVGNSFPFLGREASVDTVANTLVHVFRSFRRRDPQSTDVLKSARVLMCYAPCGAGKSRFGKELAKALSKNLLLRGEVDLVGALDHKFHVSTAVDGIAESDKQLVWLRLLLPLVYNKGRSFASFRSRFSNVEQFWHACKSNSQWSAESVASILDDRELKNCHVCLVHVDEAHNLEQQFIVKLVKELNTTWRIGNVQFLFVPLFTGTDPIRLTNTSGAKEQQVRLDPLAASTMWDIMKDVCQLKDPGPGRYLGLLLDSICYCPRLLQVSVCVQR
jgi:hypothetical protein